jgi:hypothetical protein
MVQLEQRLQAPPELARWEPMEPILPEDVLLPMELAVAVQQWVACQVGKWVRLVRVRRCDRSNNQSSKPVGLVVPLQPGIVIVVPRSR